MAISLPLIKSFGLGHENAKRSTLIDRCLGGVDGISTDKRRCRHQFHSWLATIRLQFGYTLGHHQTSKGHGFSRAKQASSKEPSTLPKAGVKPQAQRRNRLLQHHQHPKRPTRSLPPSEQDLVKPPATLKTAKPPINTSDKSFQNLA